MSLSSAARFEQMRSIITGVMNGFDYRLVALDMTVDAHNTRLTSKIMRLEERITFLEERHKAEIRELKAEIDGNNAKLSDKVNKIAAELEDLVGYVTDRVMTMMRSIIRNVPNLAVAANAKNEALQTDTVSRLFEAAGDLSEDDEYDLLS